MYAIRSYYAFSEFAVEGFKVAALDYLLKPVGYPDFLHAANKAKVYFDTRQRAAENGSGSDDFLFVKSEYRVVRINYNDIKYAEGMREYVRIHTLSGERIMSLMSMKSLEQKLRNNFV